MENFFSIFSRIIEWCCPNEHNGDVIRININGIEEDEINPEVQASRVRAGDSSFNRQYQNYIYEAEEEETPVLLVTRIQLYNTGSLNDYQSRLTAINRRTRCPLNVSPTILKTLQEESEAADFFKNGQQSDGALKLAGLGYSEQSIFAFEKSVNSRSASPEETFTATQPSNK